MRKVSRMAPAFLGLATVSFIRMELIGKRNEFKRNSDELRFMLNLMSTES